MFTGKAEKWSKSAKTSTQGPLPTLGASKAWEWKKRNLQNKSSSHLKNMSEQFYWFFPFLNSLSLLLLELWKLLSTEESVWAQVVVVKNSPMTCQWCRTYRHHGEGCALVSWDENWCVWWEYPFGAKGNETLASGWSGSTLYTVCLGCCTQIPEEGYDTEEMQASTQKTWESIPHS